MTAPGPEFRDAPAPSTPPRGRDTKGTAFKKAVRARMAETGESYTDARKALLAEPVPPRAGGAQ